MFWDKVWEEMESEPAVSEKGGGVGVVWTVPNLEGGDPELDTSG